MRFGSRKGFSLVELMVASALLLIALAIGYSFFSFGTSAFTNGEDKSIVQNDVRLACGYITREFRNVTDLQFVTSKTANDGYYYFEFSSANKTITFYTQNTLNTVYTTGDSIDTFTYSISQVNGKYVMEFTVEGTEGGQTYSTPSKVMLVNLTNVPTNSDKGYTIIRYKRP